MKNNERVLLLTWGLCFTLLPARADEEAQKALQQGLTAFRTGKFEAALNFFSAALNLDSGLLSAHFWRGRAYVEKQGWKEAEQDFRRVLEAKPESVESLYWLGHVLEAQGRRKEALDCYEKALQIDPRHQEAAAGCERLKSVRRLLPSPEPPPGVGERAAALWRKLAGQQDATVVILGDSLSFGMGVENSQADAFPFLLRTMLQEQFANPRVRVIDAGVAGETSALGLWRLESHVLAQKPDLVIVQFGGNDSQKLNLDDYRRNLKAIIEQTRAEGQAEVLLATPPMDVKEADSPFVKAVKEVGTETGAPVADFDTALRSVERDYRGFFPNYSHPNEYGHAMMARELLRAFRQLMKLPEVLEVTIGGQAGWIALGTNVPVSVGVQNLLEEAQSGELTLTMGESTHRESFDLAGKGTKDWTFSLPLPTDPSAALRAGLPAGRSSYQRLLAMARSPHGMAFDFKWLTLAPRLACPVLAQKTSPPAEGEGQPGAAPETEATSKPEAEPDGKPAEEPEAKPGTAPPSETEAEPETPPPAKPVPDWAADLPRVALGEAHVVDGRARWDGPEDASAAFVIAQDADTFHVQVEVTDDHIVREGSIIPAFNDCVELFFDLRPLAERGKPFYTPQVFLVFISPPGRKPGDLKVIPLDAPAGVTDQWQVQATRSKAGYTIAVAIPRGFLEGVAGGPLTSFGFDVAVDDADTAGERQTQLMWVGTEHNFGNPRGFGEIILAGKEEGSEAVRMSLW